MYIFQEKTGLNMVFEIKDISNNIINFSSPLAKGAANNSAITNNRSRTLPIGAAADIDGNFKNPNGFPWAINISGEYNPPLPGIKRWNGYNFFINWATSGGVSYPDWFTDLPGRRNNNNLNN
jgi:hypothetical protein